MAMRYDRWMTAMAIALSLAGCANPEAPGSPSAAAMPAGKGGIMGPLPAGYRDLGTTVVGEPGSGYFIGPIQNPAIQSASTLSLKHAKAVFDARATPYPVQASDCVGFGDKPQRPMTVQHLASAEDEVRAGIACAQLRYPGAIWPAARLISSVEGDRYLTVIALVDKEMRPFEVYAEISRFADWAAKSP